MDGRLALLQKIVANRVERITPKPCLDSPYGYAYPEVQDVFKTAPGSESKPLEELAAMGYLRAEFYDKIYLCPSCSHYALNFRELCPQCHSGNINIVRMVHHLRCGHVAPDRDFQDGIQLRCPKCTHTLRHIGIDYERPSASFLCNACSFIFSESKVSCLCLKCGHSLPVERVPRRLIYAYVPTAKAAIAVASGVLQETAPAGFVDPEFVVYTRQFFNETLQQQLRSCARYNRAISVLLVSCDHVSAYEHAFGFKASGEMQRRATHIIKENLRESDIPAVLADGILGIILVDTPATGARTTAERLCQRQYQENPPGQEPKITLSVGIAFYGPETAEASALIAAAQDALKQAREAGGNCVRPQVAAAGA